jgi:uncharacterized protein with PIN domain
MLCSFRFYGSLNDFLPAARRGRAFRYLVRHVASVKDVIEAIGVPHPEVEVIVVNGAAEDFLYRVRDGDRVAVYPMFRSIDLSDVIRVGTPPPEPVRFAVDEHLGKLASLLRLAGFDAASGSEDSGLAPHVAADARVVLTRDVVRLKRNDIRWGHWVRSVVPVRQLAEVMERFELAGCVQPFSRCLRCNVPVVRVDAEAVASRLLPRTRAEFREFHECPSCGRIYWKGSHYHDMCRLLDSLGAHTQ